MARLDLRLDAREIMDDPALPEPVYRAVLGDLARANRLTLAHRPTLAFLARALAGRGRPGWPGRGGFSLLDVGFGEGGMLRRIAAFARARGLCAQLTGVDCHPLSAAIARAATDPALPIAYHTGDYARFAGRAGDFVISSLVAHHMTRPELLAFLAFMDAHAARGWLINDLHRHRLSHAAYPVLARLAGWHPIVRQDGQTSIARSFRPHEWRELLAEARIEGARVYTMAPFRLCVEKIR